MSGMEVLAIVACVAGVVSAYKDGGLIIKQIKAKRAAKKAPAPTESLEISLSKGPPAVEDAKNQGIEKYGPSYAYGDAIAVDALRDILIHLQGTLLKSLIKAHEDDNIQDFNIVVETSDHGRMKSVMVLNELYMRMAQAAPLPREPSLASRVQTLDSTTDSRSPWDRQDHPSYDRQDLPLSPIGLQTQSHANTHSTPSAQDHVVGWSTAAEGKPNRRWFSSSRTGKASENTTLSNSIYSGQHRPASTMNMTDSPLRVRPSGVSPPRRSTSLGETEERPPLTWQQSSGSSVVEEVEENPWASEKSPSSFPSSPNPNQGVQHLRSYTSTVVEGKSPLFHSSSISTHYMQSKTGAVSSRDNMRPPRDAKPAKIRMPTWPRKRSSTDGTQLLENRSLSQDSDRTENISPPNSQISPPLESSTTEIQVPYGGFCLGAYKLQVGFRDEGFKLRNQSVALTGQSQYWACANSHCVFDIPARKLGKGWDFTNVVKVLFGVKYRWTFLAKSHVALPKSKNREFHFLCPFCVAQRQPAGPHRSLQAFMEHVSTHRGQEPESSLSDKITCIFGRVAHDHEVFDINLTPYEIAQTADAKVLEQSFATSVAM